MVLDHSIKRPGQRLSRASRGAASRTVVRRGGAFRESVFERGHRRCPREFRFAAPTWSIAVSRSACSPAAFSVPFLAGQKGDTPERDNAEIRRLTGYVEKETKTQTDRPDIEKAPTHSGMRADFF
jgi:hypothetical protein